jgi:glycerol uptake facilitator-like aquaporin
MAEKLCGGNVGLALLANAIATGGALVALILAFGPQSGAHMNPVVTLAAAATEGLRWHAVPAYIAAQLAGAILGVWLARISCSTSRSGSYRSTYGQECRNGSPR